MSTTQTSSLNNPENSFRANERILEALTPIVVEYNMKLNPEKAEYTTINATNYRSIDTKKLGSKIREYRKQKLHFTQCLKYGIRTEQ